MLDEILRYINNWFVVPYGIHLDTYTIADGGITLSFLQENQYFRIVGSIFNDGVYRYNSDLSLTDETFEGAIWALAIPNAVLDIANEIERWQTDNAKRLASPYTSESFGGYSYTKATDANTGNAITWQTVYGSRLGRWRKI